MDSILYTPHGEKRMRDIKVGSLVACPDGTYSPVIAIHPQGKKQLYRVTFIDGRSVLATDEHLWYAKIVGRKNKLNREFSIYTTLEIIDLLKKAKQSKSTITPNILVPLTKPVNFTPVTNRYLVRHTIDPYTLGFLLGDGCFVGRSISFTTADEEIAEFISKKYNVSKRKAKYQYGIKDGGELRSKLDAYGLYGKKSEDKFIPEKYKIADIETRLQLIRGLFDADSHIDNRGHIEYTTVSKQLSRDVQWVVRSLGGKATISEKQGSYGDTTCQKAYRVYVNITGNLHRLTRKSIPKPYNGGNGNLCNRIVSIEYEKEDYAQCITLRDPKGLYLTDDFIVTHNSYFGCTWCYAQALRIIEACGITEEESHPIPIGFMGRKQGRDFTATTLETWKREIPADKYVIKGNPAEIIIDNKVKIHTGGLDRQETINKFNSAEYFFFFIDQAEETTKDDISVLRGSLRGQINGQHIPYKGLFTANPAQCWLKEDFIDNPSERRVYIPALPTDNPHLPDRYIDTLKEAFRHRPELLSAYLEGDWNGFDGSDQVIHSSWILAAKKLQLNPPVTKRFLVCDPARFGDDETVIYLFENTRIKDSIIFGKKDTHYTSGKLNVLSIENGDIPIIVDGDGIGGGIIDNLNAYDRNVIEHRGSEKAINDTRYYNRRAESWDIVGQMFCDGDIDYNAEDELLANQLATPKYKFRNGKILLESKDDIKERTGRSPDRGDAFVMAMANYDKIDSVNSENLHSSVTVPSWVGAA
jgi:hypothetical protein